MSLSVGCSVSVSCMSCVRSCARDFPLVLACVLILCPTAAPAAAAADGPPWSW